MPSSEAESQGPAGGAAARRLAFALADRRCRILAPSSRDLYRRALAHRASGRREAAERDLAAAAALDPTDGEIAVAVLAWGGEEGRTQAARRVLRHGFADAQSRRRALEVLFAAGEPAVWRLARTAAGIAGWLAWRRGEILRLGAGAEPAFLVEPDPAHPLAGPRVHAADVRVETDAAALTLALGSRERVLAAPENAAPTFGRIASTPAPARVASTPLLTVIVPVHRDFTATRACLEALHRAPPRAPHRLIVVDDASPEPALAGWLDERAGAGAFSLLRNAVNLGFAASVNRALALREGGDALLLNADTLAPPGAIDRLAALARSRSGLGTLTPFSNNGELTSWPLPHEANPLPGEADIAALDAAARAVNGDALVDMPTGVGFCLYITASCLDALGGLPEHYGQGYFEDAEFSLAAREKGFRNVAAPGVFVGHAGSRSFGSGKRALVARNLAIAESRFPGLRLETAAFVAADPLRPFRAALDAATPPKGPLTLIVGEGGAAAPALSLRAPGNVVTLTAIGGGPPQSLAFDGAAPALSAYLAALDLAAVEWRDPAEPPAEAFAALLALAAPHRLRLARLTPFLPAPARSCAGAGPEPCPACAAAPAPEPARARLRRVLARTGMIEPLDRMAEAFVRRLGTGRVAPLAAKAPPPPSSRPIRRLGALYPRRCAAAERLLLALSRRLAMQGMAELVVFGAAIDEEALMATGRAFVTGRVAPEEYSDVAGAYEIDAVLAPERGAGFAGLEAMAAAGGLAKAYYDASLGLMPLLPGDLSLDPRICDGKSAILISRWIAGERRG